MAGRPHRELRARVVTWPPLRLARLGCERGSVAVVQAAGSQNRVEESWRLSAWISIARSRRWRFCRTGKSNRNVGSNWSTIVSPGSGERLPAMMKSSSKQPATTLLSKQYCTLRQTYGRRQPANGSRNRLCAREDRQDRCRRNGGRGKGNRRPPWSTNSNATVPSSPSSTSTLRERRSMSRKPFGS